MQRFFQAQQGSLGDYCNKTLQTIGSGPEMQVACVERVNEAQWNSNEHSRGDSDLSPVQTKDSQALESRAEEGMQEKETSLHQAVSVEELALDDARENCSAPENFSALGCNSAPPSALFQSPGQVRSSEIIRDETMGLPEEGEQGIFQNIKAIAVTERPHISLEATGVQGGVRYRQDDVIETQLNSLPGLVSADLDACQISNNPPSLSPEGTVKSDTVRLTGTPCTSWQFGSNETYHGGGLLSAQEQSAEKAGGVKVFSESLPSAIGGDSGAVLQHGLSHCFSSTSECGANSVSLLKDRKLHLNLSDCETVSNTTNEGGSANFLGLQSTDVSPETEIISGNFGPVPQLIFSERSLERKAEVWDHTYFQQPIFQGSGENADTVSEAMQSTPKGTLMQQRHLVTKPDSTANSAIQVFRGVAFLDQGMEGMDQFSPGQILESVLANHQNVFSNSPGETNVVKHFITVNDGLTAVSVSMDLEGTKGNLVSGTVESLISQGVIEPCRTAVFNTISMCQGEQDVNPTVELDFGQLNKFTETIPTISAEMLVEIVANRIHFCDGNKWRALSDFN
ncbi:uncharacterized protein LOC144588125 [Pogona vitticeps]